MQAWAQTGLGYPDSALNLNDTSPVQPVNCEQQRGDAQFEKCIELYTDSGKQWQYWDISLYKNEGILPQLSFVE